MISVEQFYTQQKAINYDISYESYDNFRRRIEGSKPLAALNEMSTLPSFPRAFKCFVGKYVGKEVYAACKSLKDTDKKITRESLKSFNVGEKYKLLLEKAPILMTVIFSASCRQKLDSSEVRSC